MLIWEAVTLGATPYAELSGEELPAKIQTGYRLGQPAFVGNDLYQVGISALSKYRTVGHGIVLYMSVQTWYSDSV